MPPMLIGHSQGGMQAVKVLHVLDGDYGASVPVWNPLTDFAEDRTAIRRPAHRPAAAGRRVCDSPTSRRSGAGGAAFLLPNQWSLIGKLRTIPDTVEDFTGYSIDVDLWAWTLPGAERDAQLHRQRQHAPVRNVTLSGGQQPRDCCRSPADLAEATPRRAPGSTPTSPGQHGRRPPTSAEANISGPRTSGTSVKKHWVHRGPAPDPCARRTPAAARSPPWPAR